MKLAVFILAATAALTTLVAASETQGKHLKVHTQIIRPVTARQSIWGTITNWLGGKP